MANIIPQYPKVNRYTWIKAERYERQIAKKLNRNLNLVLTNGDIILLGVLFYYIFLFSR